MNAPRSQAPQRRWCCAVLAGLAACLGTALPAQAQAQAQSAYPTRPVTLVVPYPPGGSADTVGRLVGQRLSEELGQPVLIDNRPGAGTAVGAAFVAKASPDGYTLLLGSGSTLTMNPAIRPNLPYDALGSFEPVAIVARIPLILLANRNVPIGNVKEFASAVRAAPDKYSYASFGTGTSSHFTGEIILQAVGAKIMHVPYRGSAPAMTDLIGGQVPFSVDTVTAAIPQLKGGKVKAIAVTTRQRSSQLPQVPTFAEAGYPEVDADTWIMVVAPKGTPAPVRERLEKTLAKIVATPQAQAALQAQGAEPAFAGAAASLAQIERELPLMRAVARRANIQAD
ncbi:Bug family tripartite tricarboxylate transporter substrate binding protein [Variovorax boronicumulans]|uniref:Bug family tripartite tricarboxylate transporter substrate binding protein n=1 Tax=Variovorax boronicumulans TaxID=436515 RepID=UPI00085C69A4|nr:tripartite tricarboxylate transporter substrate binding protein [Variovorax boronicumulans]OEZ30823.1 ABC transporter substrate-binding protein [Variovorax boronicumulans]